MDTSSRHVNFVDEHLPEIKIRKASEIHLILKFEITFFLKTDKLKSAFKLCLTSPGRKLLPILVYCIFKSNELLFKLILKTIKVQLIKINNPFIISDTVQLICVNQTPILSSTRQHFRTCDFLLTPAERRYFDVVRRNDAVQRR